MGALEQGPADAITGPDQVVEWLEGIGLPHYSMSFLQQRVDSGRLLARISRHDLPALRVLDPSHADIIMAEIQKLSSVPARPPPGHLSNPSKLGFKAHADRASNGPAGLGGGGGGEEVGDPAGLRAPLWKLADQAGLSPAEVHHAFAVLEGTVVVPAHQRAALLSGVQAFQRGAIGAAALADTCRVLHRQVLVGDARACIACGVCVRACVCVCLCVCARV